MSRRVFLLGCLLLIFTIGCQRSPCDDPELNNVVGEKMERSFTSEEGRFKFDLPTRQPSPSPAGNGKTMKEFRWLVVNRGQYLITYYDYEGDVERGGQSDVVFDKLRDMMAAKGEGKVEVDKPLLLSGHPGREIQIRDDVGTHVQRYYLVGPRLYTVSVYVPYTLYCGFNDAIRILDTFALAGENTVASNAQGKMTSPTPGQSGHSPSLTTN